MKESELIKKSFIFFILAFFFSMILCRISIFFTNDHRINVIAYSLGVPLALLLMRGKDFLELENIKEQKKWLIIGFVTPFIYVTILYFLGKYLFPFEPSMLNQNKNILFSVVFILLSVVFEEIGWRGYLYKYFTAEGWLKMNLLISIFWALWHYPAILYGGFPISEPFAVGIILFFINMILASFILGWIRQKTGGIISPILVHAGNNIAMVIFGVTGPFLSESGIFFTIFLTAFVIYTKAWRTPIMFNFSVIKEKYLR